ncbi:hypothetical protein TI39_contig5819g00003 [Zymoseptoria brevis]|uniref:Uncharacterized protein n=1 Tax=Zymoseptoria brevis TaxID=1047168 RepID=A0A0F4G696_9PEZI|nr:hypothetical protein TI39_contig5819g00003 [Zymoseptoria brevis]
MATDTTSNLDIQYHRPGYPGLMCDIESYIYMPLLEEQDYIPTRKYASGEEIRLYLEKTVEK